MLLSLVQVFFATFGVIDPVGNVAPFISLTKDVSEKRRREIATRGVVRAWVVIMLFIFLGTVLLDVFRISIVSFSIAGGLLTSLIGLQLVLGVRLASDDDVAADPHAKDVSMVPLAMPLLAGPGMLTLAVILTRQYGYAVTVAGVTANLLLAKLLFDRSEVVLRLLGRGGAHAFAKIIGLILVAMGIEFIRDALGM